MFLRKNALLIQCQVIDHKTSAQVTCTAREAKWRCEVIGPHEVHKVYPHTVMHERMGNGFSCRAVEERLKRESGQTPGWRD